MTPQPKRKHSSGRRDRRRAHDALANTNLVVCSNCGEFKGREVIEIKEEKK
jgi:large subunit ribosomal protein L32